MPRPDRTAPALLATLTLAVATPAGDPPSLTSADAESAVRSAIPQVEMIRGLDFKEEVPVKVIDDAAAREHLLERVGQFFTEEELQSEQQVYVLLGMAPEGFRLLDAFLEVMDEQAGGYYDPQSKSFVLLDDMPAGVAPMIAAHELTHAIEDQHFDLDSRLEEARHNGDLSFARSAIHEGSAMLVMSLYSTVALADGTMTLDDLEALGQSEATQAEKLDGLPDALKRPLIGSYLLGMDFLARGDPTATVLGGFPIDDVNACYRSGPRSSEQILHPEKYWDEDLRDDPTEVGLAEAGRLLGKGWKRRGTGVLGELVLGALVGAPTPGDLADPSAALGGGEAWSNEASTGWDGDRWELWARRKKRVLLLATVWDSPRDADEFANALRSREGLTVRAAGSRVAIVAGTAGRRTDAILDALLADD